MPATFDHFSNFATSTIAYGAGGVGTVFQSTDTSFTLKSGDGAKFPSSTPFMVELSGASLTPELFKCMTIAGDTLTGSRAQEGTSAQTWPVGTTVQCVATAGSLADLWNRVLEPNFNVMDYGATGNGTTDDTAAINSAISAAASAGGGIVYFPAGTYITSASLVLTSDGIILQGAGMDVSSIKPASGSNFDVISTPIPAASGTAGYVRNYVGVTALHLDCSQMSGLTNGQGNGIHFYGARYSYIRDVYISSSPNWCIIFDGDATPNFGYNCEVRSCIFDLCAAGILISGSEAHEIVQNKFKYAKTTTAANQPSFTSPSTTAMHLLATGGYLYVAGNVFGNSGNYTSEAVRLSNSGPCKVVGNRFDQCHAEAIRTTSGNHVIVGNQIGNPGSTVTGKSGILLGAGHNVVSGNTFDTTNGAANFAYCISEPSAQTSNLIIGNALVAGTSGYISLNAASTGDKVAQNMGYNPVGHAVTQPSMTSGAVVNANGVDCTVYVVGGSVSQTQVGGTSTGLGVGSFRVPVSSSIQLTYTNAPTWQWFGD